MSSLEIISLVATSTQLALTAGLIIWPIIVWGQAYHDAPAELTTLIDEVESTRNALRPLEIYVRQGNIEHRSRQAIIATMTKLSDMEDQLFRRLENHLGQGGSNTGGAWSFRSRGTWLFKRGGFKELAKSISNQKVTILALQVAELTHQTVTLVKFHQEPGASSEDNRLPKLEAMGAGPTSQGPGSAEQTVHKA